MNSAELLHRVFCLFLATMMITSIAPVYADEAGTGNGSDAGTGTGAGTGTDSGAGTAEAETAAGTGISAADSSGTETALPDSTLFDSGTGSGTGTSAMDSPSLGTIDAASLFPPGYEQSKEEKCSGKELDISSKEVQNLMDLLKNGFLGEQMTGNALPDEQKSAVQKKLDEFNDLAQKYAAEHPVEYKAVKAKLDEFERDDPKKFAELKQKFLDQLEEQYGDASSTKKTAPNNEIVEVNESTGEAVKVKVPNEEIYPIEITHWLNEHITGPFAFGIVLNDSLRVGRCDAEKKLDDPDCGVSNSGLKYRNSGEGIVADVKNVWNDLKGRCPDSDDPTTLCKTGEWFSEKGKQGKNLVLNLFGKEVPVDDKEADYLYTMVQEYGKDALTAQSLKRVESKRIPNSVVVAGFSASMSTNCESAEKCEINSYSLFDKFFNSWTSTDMALSNAMPALKNTARKIFTWHGARIPGFRALREAVVSPIRKRLFNADTYLGKWWAERLEANKNGHGNLKSFWQEMVNNHYLLQTSGFQTFWGKQIGEGGFLSTLKSPEEKRAFIRMVKDARTIGKANQAILKDGITDYRAIADAYGVYSPQEKQAMVNLGQKVVHWLNNIDEPGINMDSVEWVMKNPFHGFYNKGLRANYTGEVININEDPRHLRKIFDIFEETGTFKNMDEMAIKAGHPGGAYEVTKDGKLVLYGVEPTKMVNTATWGELDKTAKFGPERFVDDQFGQYLKLSPWSAEFAKSRTVGNPNIFEGKWTPSMEMSPEDLSRRLYNGRLMGNLNVMAGSGITSNFDTMLDTLRERNFIERRYWSILDKLMAQEDELFRSYFSLKGGIKWTVMPFGYWWLKKGGGGAFEEFSHYMLPDTWTSVRFSLGREDTYREAYIDFFANEGSDEGDIFAQVLNKLPWKLVVDKVTEKFFPGNDLYQSLTGKGGRSKVEDLTYYLSSPQDCSGCSVTLYSNDFDAENSFNDFSPYFSLPSGKTNSFVLEYTKTAEARKKGQTIIAFAHHMDLSGDTGDIVPDETAEAEKEKTKIKIAGEVNRTCEAASIRMLDKMPLFGGTLKKIGLTGSKSALALAGMENLSYFIFGAPGIAVSVFTQFLFAPELQDCVDAEGGYYVHYFASAYETEKKPEDKSKEPVAALSTEQVMDFVKTQSDSLLKGFKSNEGTTNEALDKMRAEIEDFVDSGKKQENVQATVSFNGTSSGQMTSNTLFYLWFKGQAMPSKYRQDGKISIKDKTTGKEQVIDFAKGTKTFDGKTILFNPDAVRLMTTNTAGPFEEIPHYLNEVCVLPSNEAALEINAKGETKILSQQLKECLENAVMHQTGLPLNDALNLQTTFGLVKAITTTTQPNVAFIGTEIRAEGDPRYIGGRNSNVVLFESMEAKLFDPDNTAMQQKTQNNSTENSSSNNSTENSSSGNSNANNSSENSQELQGASLGIIQSIQFENGVILLKPDGCLLVWLQHHNDGVLSKNDVKGIKAKLDEIINPETDCKEPAIDLSMIGNLESDASKSKVEKFNTSLEHFGPFQVFETPTKRYMFWANPEEDCKQYLRIFDKETGKITDIPIQDGTLKQTDTGISFLDEDGKEHSLDFTTEDGVPKISFDKQEPETLIAAQGPNGSFWFDPEKGLMYAENGQLLPLIEAFRKGIQTKSEGGSAVSTAAGNTLNVDLGTGKSDNLLDLPSLPENLIALMAYILGLVLVIAVIRREIIG